MSENRKRSDAAAWGCLGAGMTLLGAFSIYVFKIAGGTDYDVEYMATASAIGGVAILVLLMFQSSIGHAKLHLPRLSPYVAVAVLILLFFVLLF